MMPTTPNYMPEWVQVFPGIYMGQPVADGFDESVGMSNIPHRYRETHRLFTWKHRDGEDWWDYILEYANGGNNHHILTILGTPGIGKTHLVVGIGYRWMEIGKTCLYYQTSMLLDALRQDANTDKQPLSKFVSVVGLLILDDLGVEYQTEWSSSKLDTIIDQRYSEGKNLIVTSNLALERLPERISDRLAEGKIIQLKGQSYRRKAKQKEG